MSDCSFIECVLENIWPDALQRTWRGYHSISPWIEAQKIDFPRVPDTPRIKLIVRAFETRVATSDVVDYATQQDLSVAGHEWLWVANAMMYFHARPLVALAPLSSHTNGAALYTKCRSKGIVDLHVSWGQFAWSDECLFLFTAPV